MPYHSDWVVCLFSSIARRVEPVCISGVTGGSQQLTALETEVSRTVNEWQKHPIVTGPKAPCILGIDYLRRGCFKNPKGYQWDFCIATSETEEIKQLCLVSWRILLLWGCWGLKNNRCQLLPKWCTSSNTTPTETSWSPSRSWSIIWRIKKWSANSLTLWQSHMASEKIYWREETDSRLPWPEWSHATAECCCARHARTSVSAGVKGSQLVCHHWPR